MRRILIPIALAVALVLGCAEKKQEPVSVRVAAVKVAYTQDTTQQQYERFFTRCKGG